MEEKKININNFLSFVLYFGDEKIGSAEDLDKEVAIVCSMAKTFFWKETLLEAAVMPQNFNIYKCRGLLNKAAELSREEVEQLKATCKRKLAQVCKKIIWLNGQCKRLYGEPFLNGYIDLSDINSCVELLEEFYAIPNSEDLYD